MKHYLTLLLLVGFCTNAFSQKKDNIAIIKEYYKAFNENDAKKIAYFFAEGFVDYSYGNRPSITYKSIEDYVHKLE